MSEAGPLAAKPGYRWRTMRPSLWRESGRRRWDLLVEGVLDLPSRIPWWGAGQADPGPRSRARDAGQGGGVRQKAPARSAIRLVAGPQRSREFLRGTPRIPWGMMASQQLGDAAPTAWPTQGWRRQRWPSSVAVDGFAQKAGLPPSRMRAEGHGGRKGVSLELGNGVSFRVLVTTSRLQRLVRGILLAGRAARRCCCGAVS